VSNIVIDLQKDALNPDVRVEDLLRKALVVSKKLNIVDIEKWITNELNGYSKTTDIPAYRKIRGIIKAFNPYQGWIPVIFEDEEDKEIASTSANIQAIGEISAMAKNEDKSLYCEISPELHKELCRQNGVTFDMRIFMSKTEMIGILEHVRNEILNWSLDLEKSGIFGEELSFTQSEKEIAAEKHYTIINNIGSISNSQIQQASTTLEQKIEIDNLDEIIINAKKLLDENKLSKEKSDELESDIVTIESQQKSPNPKQNIIAESIKSMRTIAEGAAGSLIASGLITLITKIMGS
jgi:hypothetical protein